MSSTKVMLDKSPVEIDAQAMEWQRVMSGVTTPEQEREFSQWYDESELNRQAFLEAELLSESFDQLASDKDSVLEELLPKSQPNTVEKFPSRDRHGNYWGLAIAASVLLTIATTLFLFKPEPISESAPVYANESYSSQKAELKTYELIDGSILTLGPDSELEVIFDGDLRLVKLISGKAFFDVAKDSTRPFIVETAENSVKVVGTRFDVNSRTQGADVSVVEGVVHVFNGATTARSNKVSQAPTTLVAGQRARANGLDRIEIESFPHDSQQVSWLQGRLVYQDMALGDVLDDVNRYLPSGQTINLADHSLRNEQVTISVQVERLVELPRMLSQLLDLSLEENLDGVLLI